MVDDLDIAMVAVWSCSGIWKAMAITIITPSGDLNWTTVFTVYILTNNMKNK